MLKTFAAAMEELYGKSFWWCNVINIIPLIIEKGSISSLRNIGIRITHGLFLEHVNIYREWKELIWHIKPLEYMLVAIAYTGNKYYKKSIINSRAL